MPTLQFKGKNIIWNHHLSVPYHTLEEVSKLHFQPDKSNGNLIIEGDNLLALKALLPMYAGKVKCICIDPPYNTGNEGWVYNDNANSPLIKDWLGKEVGKDDLTRHDKWLCMMTPRLRLLRELLSDDGAIFICIDDNEIDHLQMLMGEIFGKENFIANFIWKKKSTSTNVAGTQVSSLIDYVLCYGRSDKSKIRQRVRLKETREYPYEDKEGRYRLTIIEKKHAGSYKRVSMLFPILGIKPRGGKRWQIGEDTARELEKRKRFIIDNGMVKLKIYDFEDKDTFSAQPNLLDQQGTTDSATKMVNEDIFERPELFENPKPIELISHLISISTEQEDIILDSFSGSGTTGHAVMDLNKEDGGNRKFILVQMTEATEKESDKNICKDITRERIKRAIEKYGYNIGFQYLRVGQPLDAETLLKGKLPEYKIFAKYVYYLCTGENLKDEKKISEKKFFIGTFGNQAIYLIYKENYEALTRMAINLEFAEKIIADQPDKKRIVYAPACFLDEEYMEGNQIEFVSIPYNLFQRKNK